MNKELMEALDILEKVIDRLISLQLDFRPQALLQMTILLKRPAQPRTADLQNITACKNHFGKADNVKVEIDKETCDFLCYAEKEVVEEVEDDVLQISLEDARELSHKAQLGDMLHVEIKSKEFGRIATQNAKNVILQKIREEERSVIYNQYYEKEKDVVTGIVQRHIGRNISISIFSPRSSSTMELTLAPLIPTQAPTEKDVVTGIVQRHIGRNISINLGKADAILNESEQVKGENFRPTERIKVYILEVKNTPKGPRILVSRTHPELVKRLFEAEVTEIKDGTVEIMSIARS